MAVGLELEDLCSKATSVPQEPAEPQLSAGDNAVFFAGLNKLRSKRILKSTLY
jgi:hypothetical protein